MDIIGILKKIRQVVRAGRIYLYDLKNDVFYTTLCIDRRSQQEMLLASLVIAAHTIEKGLTMPHKKFPFGEAKAREILADCKAYIKHGYDITESRFVDIVNILKEYRDVSLVEGIIDKNLDSEINSLLFALSQSAPSKQYYSISRNDYFTHSKDGYSEFSASRHSCRNLPGHVSDDALFAALKMSMNAPSTCNRQSHRIHLLQSNSAKQTILSIQSGNRGFGDIVDQFILVTSDLRCWPSMHQRNAPYIDGGIYLMNLLNCLHYENIAACTLNLYLDKKKTQRLHKELNIPNNEVPIAVIAIGIPPTVLDLTRSHRRGYEEITSTH